MCASFWTQPPRVSRDETLAPHYAPLRFRRCSGRGNLEIKAPLARPRGDCKMHATHGFAAEDRETQVNRGTVLCEAPRCRKIRAHARAPGRSGNTRRNPP